MSLSSSPHTVSLLTVAHEERIQQQKQKKKNGFLVFCFLNKKQKMLITKQFTMAWVKSTGLVLLAGLIPLVLSSAFLEDLISGQPEAALQVHFIIFNAMTTSRTHQIQNNTLATS